MRLHRFVEKFNNVGIYEITNPERVRQITKVLRLQVGDQIILSDGAGHHSNALIQEINKKSVVVLISKIENTDEKWNKVKLYCNILKRENFEFVTQKATELGVSEIIPLLSARTVKQNINHMRLEKIIEEATEQCERDLIPNLAPETNLENALVKAKEEGIVIFFEKFGTTLNNIKVGKIISIFIGPEGGFSEKEISEARSAGYNVSSLGPLVLRGETAAMIATYRAVEGI